MFYCLAGIVDIEGLKTSIHQAIHYCFIEKGLEATYHKWQLPFYCLNAAIFLRNFLIYYRWNKILILKAKAG